QYQNIDDRYVDTGLKVTIENTATQQIWEDYVSLRFFEGQYQWTLKAESTEGNSNAALHGFLVYPDKVCQYFDINDNAAKTILVPTFKEDDNYILVFSGAVAGGTLAESTEMYYTMQEGDSPMGIDKSDKASLTFGGDNNTEINAYPVDKDHFQGYLSEGKIKYFLISGKTVVPYSN
ncbi:MAG: hypothetical protein J6Y01_03615, partial [Spirochaetales bacterium]|nr:hypothetical protein [Spirochaetales bacterium]